MAERGHRFYGTTTVRVTKVVNAPLRYVYEWSTDYRPDDAAMAVRRPRPRFRVVKLSPNRVLRIRTSPNGGPDPDVAVDVVRLRPPSSWHTDQIDETDRESVDYRLTALGPKKTRLHLLVTERWLTPDHPTRSELVERLSRAWDRYAGHIEARYRAGRPARG
jgi:hypothetical protein